MFRIEIRRWLSTLVLTTQVKHRNTKKWRNPTLKLQSVGERTRPQTNTKTTKDTHTPKMQDDFIRLKVWVCRGKVR